MPDRLSFCGWVLVVGASAFFAAGATAATVDYAGTFKHLGPGITAYGTAGYDLYSTTPVGTVYPTGGANSGPNHPFGAGTRLTSLPSYVTSVTAPAANGSYAGVPYATINNPAGGQVEAGITYFQSTSAVEGDLLTVNVGQPAANFYIGLIAGFDTTLLDYPTSLRLRQTSGVGSGNSGLIATTPDALGGLDLYVFHVTGALAGDAFTFSGVQVAPNPGNGIHVMGTAGLLFSAVNAPEPSGVCAAIAAASVTLARRGRSHSRSSRPAT